MSDDDKKSPLERYLEKQKKTREPKKSASAGLDGRRPPRPATAASPTSRMDNIERPQPDLDKWEKRAIEQGVPAAPPPPPASPAQATATPQASPRPAPQNLNEVPDIAPRFLAALIDGVIVYSIKWPISKVVIGILAFPRGGMAVDAQQGLDYLIFYGILFAYYGYFYSKRGASPGKMLLGLAVVDEQTNANLSPAKAFFREAIGKFISAVPFFIGFFVALFRDDHRALHDLLFDTKVIRR